MQGRYWVQGTRVKEYTVDEGEKRQFVFQNSFKSYVFSWQASVEVELLQSMSKSFFTSAEKSADKVTELASASKTPVK